MDVGDILAWAVWGLVVGAFARLFKRGSGGLGIFWTIALGIAGSLLGGYVASELLGIGDDDEFDFGSFVIAVAGSFVVLSIVLRITRPRRGRPSFR
jgi:uncharacterized membrane protein YeaQ/YmgE (transglycosylase-associated protein family)